MHCNSPRASAGLSMFAASIDPAADPAPTIVWISSIKRIMFGFLVSSFRRALIRSSNCPRYFVPATTEAMSRLTTRLSNSTRETFRCTMRCANPSTMADFPTPGSPISTGLFFFLRLRICASRSISFSRPTMGSSLPSAAAFVMSVPKLSSTGVSLGVDDAFCAVVVLVLGWLGCGVGCGGTGSFLKGVNPSSSSSSSVKPSCVSSTSAKRSTPVMALIRS